MAELSWGPYSGSGEASWCLGRFADRVFGPGFGVAWGTPDGAVMLRPPTYDSDGCAPVLCVAWHGTMAPVVKDRDTSFIGRIEDFCHRLLSDYGKQTLRQSVTANENARAFGELVKEDVWKPINEFLDQHKTAADGVAAGLDLLGVLAAAGVGIAIVGGGVVLAPVAIAAALAAGAGSVALLAIDGRVFYLECQGDKAAAEEFEDKPMVQWARIGATVLLLPDLAYGGVRALREVRALPAEIREANQVAAESTESAAEQLERADLVRNPAKHPTAVQKHRARANRYARAAIAAQERAEEAQWKLFVALSRDVPASWIGAPAAAGLLITSPPKMWKGEGPNEHMDKKPPLQLLAPTNRLGRFGELAHNLELKIGMSCRP